MDRRRASLNDSRWVPFWLPFFIFGIVAIILSSVGMLLLNIAVITHDWIPGLHSGVVIIVALIITLLIAGTAAFFALRPARPSRSSHSDVTPQL